jgi:hypothetical protein
MKDGDMLFDFCECACDVGPTVSSSKGDGVGFFGHRPVEMQKRE